MRMDDETKIKTVRTMLRAAAPLKEIEAACQFTTPEGLRRFMSRHGIRKPTEGPGRKPLPIQDWQLRAREMQAIDKMTPATIMRQLQAEGHDLTATKITNYLARVKNGLTADPLETEA